MLEDQLLFWRVLNTLLALIILGCGFEIDRVTKVFYSIQYAGNGFLIQLKGSRS